MKKARQILRRVWRAFFICTEGFIPSGRKQYPDARLRPLGKMYFFDIMSFCDIITKAHDFFGKWTKIHRKTSCLNQKLHYNSHNVKNI